MAEVENPARGRGRTPVFIVAMIVTLAALYIVSQFLRNSVGVIAPDLAAEMQLSAGQIGLLSSAFFFAFAALQMPLGVALDRFGPKRCLIASAIVIMAGCVAFAAAEGAAGLVAGRMLLGLGTASVLMGPLALYTHWFSPQRFSTVTGIHIGIGGIGTLLATAPFAFAASIVGWRMSFLGVAAVSLLLGLLILALIRDRPEGMPAPLHRETLRESVAGILEAARLPAIGRLFLMQLALYSSFVLIVGLWGGPYLTHIYGYDLKARGDFLLVAAIAQIAGSFFWGPMDRLFGAYKPGVMIGCGGTILVLLVLAAAGKPPVPVLLALLAALGFSCASLTVLIAHGKALFPPRLVGRGLTLMNMGSMGGVFLSQIVTGLMIEQFPSVGGAYPLAAYRAVFLVQALFLLAACLAYLGARDVRHAPAAG